VDDKKVADAITALSGRNYIVMMGPIFTYAVTANSNQAIGMGLDSNSYMYWIRPEAKVPCVPCILYFSETMRDSAIEVRDLLKVVQAIPDAQVLYVDRKQLNAQKQELLDLSAVDIYVLLGDLTLLD
jgi:hypothetical protein